MQCYTHLKCGVCVCARTQVYAFMCVSVCVEVKDSPDVSPQAPCTFYLRQGLSLAGNFTKSVRQAAR